MLFLLTGTLIQYLKGQFTPKLKHILSCPVRHPDSVCVCVLHPAGTRWILTAGAQRDTHKPLTFLHATSQHHSGHGCSSRRNYFLCVSLCRREPWTPVMEQKQGGDVNMDGVVPLGLTLVSSEPPSTSRRGLFSFCGVILTK